MKVLSSPSSDVASPSSLLPPPSATLPAPSSHSSSPLPPPPPTSPSTASGIPPASLKPNWQVPWRTKWKFFCAGLNGGGGPDASGDKAPKQPRKKRKVCPDELNQAMIADDLEAGKLDDTSPYAELEGESKEEYFERTLRNATGAEIYLEYLIFLKSLPNVHCNKLKEIQNTVRKELRIDQIEEKISLADLRFSFSPGSPDHHPVLNALECKLGYSLTIITPPTDICLLCDTRLSRRNPNRNPTQVILVTLNGPKVASKLVWTCRKCKGSSRLNGAEEETVSYYPDRFGNDTMGYKFYPKTVKTRGLIEATQETFFENSVILGYWQEFSHGWLSSEGKCEAFNQSHKKTEMTKSIKRFLKYHKNIGKHFDKVEEDEDDPDPAGKASRMFEMKRKSLGQAVRNWCVVQELGERKMLNNIEDGEFFGPMVEGGRTVTFKKSIDYFMERVDDWRRDELYPHNCTSKECAKRGCEKVTVVDGLWKLSY